MGQIDFEDLDSTQRYKPWVAYGRSKLANLLHILELDRRLRGGEHTLRALAAHPGYAATNLQFQSLLIRMMNPIAGQSPDDGALPTLRAATDPGAKSGTYFGPSRMFELRGPPIEVTRHARATDELVAAQLWTVSEARTGVRYLSESSAQ
jgi:NAD(P)-dependent dehydrogenase (short-subunit alcohol dehydrogenase family)